MDGFESLLRAVRPNGVLVVGDVNPTPSCGLVTAKAPFGAGVPTGRFDFSP